MFRKKLSAAELERRAQAIAEIDAELERLEIQIMDLEHEKYMWENEDEDA